MTIREMLEKAEKERLSGKAQLSCAGRGREKEEPPCTIRTDFVRDRDRIVHSKSFRRLKHKTQVFIAPEGDHFRNRLTHTLEVSQIARTIARALFLNEDLTEAIALAHDIGHTPFGHAGESALSNIVGSFHHNEQSLRVIDILENGRSGLNLTYEVRNGVLCHTGERKPETLEGEVVRLSDRVAYLNHDLDDALRDKVIDSLKIPDEVTGRLGATHRERINTLILDIVEASGEKIAQSPEIESTMNHMREFLFREVYKSPRAVNQEQRAHFIIESLYKYFSENSNAMPREYVLAAEKEGLPRSVCDYIAGMTDQFAIETFQKIFIPRTFLPFSLNADE